MFGLLDRVMHTLLFNLYPTQRTTFIFSYYFWKVIDTAVEADNEIRGMISIIICRRSSVWTPKTVAVPS